MTRDSSRTGCREHRTLARRRKVPGSWRRCDFVHDRHLARGPAAARAAGGRRGPAAADREAQGSGADRAQGGASAREHACDPAAAARRPRARRPAARPPARPAPERPPRARRARREHGTTSTTTTGTSGTRHDRRDRHDGGGTTGRGRSCRSRRGRDQRAVAITLASRTAPTVAAPEPTPLAPRRRGDRVSSHGHGDAGLEDRACSRCSRPPRPSCRTARAQPAARRSLSCRIARPLSRPDAPA